MRLPAAPAGLLPAVLALLFVARATALHAGAGAHQRALIAAWSDEASAKETPIQRVVKLLQEMKSQLTSEAKADSETYDKMACWCETSQKDKTKAISDADTKISELESEVGSGAARDGELATKIEHLKKELAEMKESLDKATAIREKEAADFKAEEKEMVQAITMLKNAILVLSRHNSGLIQMSPGVEESVGSALRWVALKHEEMLELDSRNPNSALRGDRAAPRRSSAALLSLAAGQGSASATGVSNAVLQALARPHATEVPAEFAARVLARAAAEKEPSLMQQPAGYESYAPQSGQIFGILRQMKEEFEANLSQSQKDELKAAGEFSELKASSEKQIEASTVKLDELETDYATTIKALADAKEDLTATREQRGEDVKFLSDVRLKCQDLEHDFQHRTKARNMEIQAVNDAIGILTEDDARELFHKKMGTGASLLQVRSSTSQRAVRNRAAEVLLQAAQKLQTMQVPEGYQVWHADDKPHEKLAALAMQVQLDAFSKVKKAIDDMVAELKVQQAEEVKHKEFCGAEFNQNEKETYETEQVLQDLKDKISALEDTIARLTDEIAAAKDEISRTEVEVKKASEIREQENKEFQEEVMDQRAMQQILQKAIARMRQVYKKQALVQDGQDPQPPAQFNAYKQSSGASPVIGMMEQIVEDSAAMEKDAMAAEQEAQATYESFINDSTAAIKALNASIEMKTKQKAAAESEKEETEAQKDSTEGRLEDLTTYNADLHSQCDYVLKNFDIRQKARLEEIEALGNAKAVLSGMVDTD